jgi:regulator of replication initiation timing
MGGGVVKPDGAPTTISLESANGTSVEVSLNEVLGKLSTIVAENTKLNIAEGKLRKYVQKRLRTKFNGKKSPINEETKSPVLRKLDKMIDRQLASSKKK